MDQKHVSDGLCAGKANAAFGEVQLSKTKCADLHERSSRRQRRESTSTVMNNDNENEEMEEEINEAEAAAGPPRGPRRWWEKKRRAWPRIWQLRPRPRPGGR